MNHPPHRSRIRAYAPGGSGYLLKLAMMYLLLSVLVACAVVAPAPSLPPTATASRLPTAIPSQPRAPIRVATWNIGLDRADLTVIADRIEAFDGIDLWGLQEVNNRSAPPILAAAAADGENAEFAAIQGKAGDGLHLVALYNTDRYALLDWWELAAINTTGNVRPSLVLHLREKHSDLEFLSVHSLRNLVKT